MNMTNTEKLLFSKLITSAKNDTERVVAIDLLLKTYTDIKSLPSSTEIPSETEPPLWKSIMSLREILNVLECLISYPELPTDEIIAELKNTYAQTATRQQVLGIKEMYKTILEEPNEGPTNDKAVWLVKLAKKIGNKPEKS